MNRYAVSLLILGCLACASPSVAERTGKVDWQFKGLDQLDAAKTAALGRGGLVLVGLSGSDG